MGIYKTFSIMTAASHHHHHHHHRHHYIVIVRLIVVILALFTSTDSGGDGGQSILAFVDVVAAFERPLSCTRCRCRHYSHGASSCFYKTQHGGSFDATSKLAWNELMNHRRDKRSFSLTAAASANNQNDVDDNDIQDEKKKKSSTKLLGRQQGVYIRPSAAIERGSGFFIPGLEGPKVRLVVGSVLLILTAINHVLSFSTTTISTGNTLAEALAVAFSFLVLIQAAIEYTKDDLILQRVQESSGGDRSDGGAVKKAPTLAAKASVSSSSFQQQWTIPIEHDNIDEYWKDQVEWSAQTFLSLTPATNIMLIGGGGGGTPGKVLYSIRPTEATTKNHYRQDDDDDQNYDKQKKEESEACALALQLLSKSTSGRLSLPVSHPIVVSLVIPKSEASAPPRSVILQRISSTRTPQDESNNNNNNNNLALLVSSNQLLVSFTPQDLTWLRQLATRIVVNAIV